MEYKEFREIMESLETMVEVHPDQFKFLGKYVTVNDVITFRNVIDIHYVDGEMLKTVWIGTTGVSIALEDLEKLEIIEVKEEE